MSSLNPWTPCSEVGPDGHHHCPYADDGSDPNCDYWCREEEPYEGDEYDPAEWTEEEMDRMAEDYEKGMFD